MAAINLTGRGPITGGASLGCDPEFFISRKGVKNRHIVGSERILGNGKFAKTAPVSPDGVQVEIHPTSSYCRQGHASYIMQCMKALKTAVTQAEGKGGLKGLQVDFRQTISVSKTELARLSEGARILGCLPSENAYPETKKLEPDGKISTTRSAGGHIHFGMKAEDPANFAKLCDVLIGIPAVLMDRDEKAAIRRKKYGRAGEYRTPSHGFEYRTLSNFWMRDYVVYALIFGLAKTASGIEYTAQQAKNPTYRSSYNTLLRGDILGQADFAKVRKAINSNDFDLAYEVFNDVCRPVFSSLNTGIGLGVSNIQMWDHFIEKGLDHWFPFDNDRILNRWTSEAGYGAGWESWADSTLRGSYEKDRLAKGSKSVKIDPITGKAI